MIPSAKIRGIILQIRERGRRKKKKMRDESKGTPRLWCNNGGVSCWTTKDQPRRKRKNVATVKKKLGSLKKVSDNKNDASRDSAY